MNGSYAWARRSLAIAALAVGVLATGLLGVPAAGADATATPPRNAATAAPLSIAIAVQPFGTKVTAKVTTSLPTMLTYSTKAVSATPAAGPSPQATVAADTGGAPHGGPITPKYVLSPANFVTAHEDTLTGLTSNTRYELSVTATTQDGKTATGTTTFTTLKQRVRVTLREINITDDGDWIGDGEPLWVIGVTWKRSDGTGPAGEAGDCYPLAVSICQTSSFSEGRYFPRNSAGQFLAWTFAEENFDRAPNMFDLDVKAQEDDLIPGLGSLGDFLQECMPLFGGPCGFSSSPDASWKVPQGVEWASTAVTLKADDIGGGLHSTLTFTYELFYDNLSYPAAHNRPSSTWR
jgi:hypothetical protein